MKKTTLLFLLFLSVNFSFSQSATDYLDGLEGPTKMTVDGTTIYVNGWGKIYTVNTAASTPSATVLYTLPANFYAYKTVKLGNQLFILVENYNEATDEWFGTKIVKLDVTNPGAGTVDVVTAPTNFISCIALTGNTLYYTMEVETSPDVFTIDIYSFDATIASPTPVRAYSNFDIDVVEDIEITNNKLYLSSGHIEKIFTVDLSSSASTPVEYMNTGLLNFNKGISINAGYLYITNAHQLVKVDLAIPTPALQLIGANTTYTDVNGGTPYLANFRDVVLINGITYMTLEEQGRIVILTDTLGNPSFANQTVSVYPNPVVSDLFLTNNTDFDKYELFDITGKRVGAGVINSNSIDFSHIDNGVYVLKLAGANKQGNLKIVKQ